MRLIFTKINFNFADFAFFARSTKSCLREICLILLSTKINPLEIFVEVFFSTLSVLKRRIPLSITLNYKYRRLY